MAKLIHFRTTDGYGKAVVVDHVNAVSMEDGVVVIYHGSNRSEVSTPNSDKAYEMYSYILGEIQYTEGR